MQFSHLFIGPDCFKSDWLCNLKKKFYEELLVEIGLILLL